MTTTPTTATRPLARPIPSKEDFVPLERKPDTSKNRRRGARRSTRATRTIL